MTTHQPPDPPEGPPTIAGRVPVGDAEPSPGGLTLVVLEGGDVGRVVRVDRTLVIGRSREADLRIPGPEVSRHHARLHRSAEGRLEVEDLRSSNGVWVNDHRVSRAQLEIGDRVRVGRTVLLVTRGDEVEARFFHRVHRQVHRDELTGLERGDTILAAIESEVARTRGPLVVGMTDLDGLREVNASHGHGAGRVVVGAMGCAVREALAAAGRAGLYGGDEVILFLPRTTIVTAVELAEAIRRAVETMRVPYGAATLAVTISIGLAEWPRHGRGAGDLVAAADRALYLAKASGRNRVVTADEVASP